jgi:hypothetical protein
MVIDIKLDRANTDNQAGIVDQPAEFANVVWFKYIQM